MSIIAIVQTTASVETVAMQQEITLLLIGGIIAILSSVATFVATKLIDRHGKLKIYAKIVYAKTKAGQTWGFFTGQDDMYFQIPLWIEIQNTSNTTQVVRNLNACLYRNNKEVSLMTQINKIGDTILANNGAYSFVIEPRSIQKFDCHFTIKKSNVSGEGFFDEIKLIYFNENDKREIFHLIKINEDDCWITKIQKTQKDWSLLSR